MPSILQRLTFLNRQEISKVSPYSVGSMYLSSTQPWILPYSSYGHRDLMNNNACKIQNDQVWYIQRYKTGPDNHYNESNSSRTRQIARIYTRRRIEVSNSQQTPLSIYGWFDDADIVCVHSYSSQPTFFENWVRTTVHMNFCQRVRNYWTLFFL